MISGLFSLPLAAASGGDQLVRNPSHDRPERAPERFIVGPENAIVRTLADTATSDPPPFNPLVLCGPTGVGKTSLAHALADLRLEKLRPKNCLRVTAVDFARALAHAADTGAIADLRSRHYRCDLLLIDDVHRLQGKAGAQQFLVLTLDALVRRGALIIATACCSRRGALALSGLTPALTSRLSGGLLVSLAAPGPTARRALVRQFAQRVNLPLDDDLVEQLAGDSMPRPSRLVTAGQLRHLVYQLAGDAESRGGFVDSNKTAKLLAEETPQLKSVCRRTIGAVTRHFGVTATEVKGRGRRAAVAEARGMAMYLARRLTDSSYAEIGRQFGGRDHTTVLHACQKFAALVEQDEVTRRLADELEIEVAEVGGN